MENRNELLVECFIRSHVSLIKNETFEWRLEEPAMWEQRRRALHAKGTHIAVGRLQYKIVREVSGEDEERQCSQSSGIQKDSTYGVCFQTAWAS